mmetsp:Transcript_2894/g.6133  ORF Transcript_2894/g.6133 Transcript_2894/m.6133 type:complete len:309 (-) Transcript_2894:290-1216(-)
MLLQLLRQRHRKGRCPYRILFGELVPYIFSEGFLFLFVAEAGQLRLTSEAEEFGALDVLGVFANFGELMVEGFESFLVLELCEEGFVSFLFVAFGFGEFFFLFEEFGLVGGVFFLVIHFFFFFFFFICVRVCQSPLPRLPLLLSLPLLAVRPDLSIEMMAPLALVLLSSLSLPPSSPSSSSPTMRRHRLPRGMRLHRIGRRTKQQSTDIPLGDSNDVVVVVVVAVLPTSQREGRARQQHDRFEKQAKDAEGGGMSRQCRGEGQVMSGEEGGEWDGESAVVLVVIVGGYDDVDVIVAAIIVVGEEVEAR